MNSFKKQGDIFGHPYSIPIGSMFTLLGYQTVFKRAEVLIYLRNSLIVILSAIGLSLLFGAMAAFALGTYKFRGNRFIGLYMALGIIIPIRLGTVSIVRAEHDPRFDWHIARANLCLYRPESAAGNFHTIAVYFGNPG